MKIDKNIVIRGLFVLTLLVLCGIIIYFGFFVDSKVKETDIVPEIPTQVASTREEALELKFKDKGTNISTDNVVEAIKGLTEYSEEISDIDMYSKEKLLLNYNYIYLYLKDVLEDNLLSEKLEGLTGKQVKWTGIVSSRLENEDNVLVAVLLDLKHLYNYVPENKEVPEMLPQGILSFTPEQYVDLKSKLDVTTDELVLMTFTADLYNVTKINQASVAEFENVKVNDLIILPVINDILKDTEDAPVSGNISADNIESN